MPVPKARYRYSLEEVFNMTQVPQADVEVPRTNNYGSPSDANWMSPVTTFSLGLQNADKTVLSNMIADKTAEKLSGHAFGISDFLNYIDKNQSQLLSFLVNALERILSIFTSLVKEKNG